MVARYSLTGKRNQWGEFVVRAWDAEGRRLPECDYHTNDIEDARGTKEAMERTVVINKSSGHHCG